MLRLGGTVQPKTLVYTHIHAQVYAHTCMHTVFTLTHAYTHNGMPAKQCGKNLVTQEVTHDGN